MFYGLKGLKGRLSMRKSTDLKDLKDLKDKSKKSKKSVDIFFHIDAMSKHPLNPKVLRLRAI
jgi:hypothetical protein